MKGLSMNEVNDNTVSILNELIKGQRTQLQLLSALKDKLSPHLQVQVEQPKAAPKAKAKAKPKAKPSKKQPASTGWPTKAKVGDVFKYTRTSKRSKSRGKTFEYTVTAIDTNGKPLSWTKKGI